MRDLIYKQRKLRPAPRRGDNTSPIYLFQADVEELARAWGIL